MIVYEIYSHFQYLTINLRHDCLSYSIRQNSQNSKNFLGQNYDLSLQICSSIIQNIHSLILLMPQRMSILTTIRWTKLIKFFKKKAIFVPKNYASTLSTLKFLLASPTPPIFHPFKKGKSSSQIFSILEKALQYRIVRIKFPQ